jgi:hypothetical protein
MSAAQWYIARNKVKVGPFTGSEIKQLASCGLLQPKEYIWPEGAKKWVEAATVPGLFPKSGQKRYWLHVAGQTRGPYVAEQVKAGLNARQFNLDVQAWTEDVTQWQPLRQLDEFRNFTPTAVVTPSRAQLLMGGLELDEAVLHLAGKGGDSDARLLSTLMDLKRIYANNASLVSTLDTTIKALQAARDKQQPPAASPSPPPAPAGQGKNGN